jgi:lipoate-protein ligase B
MKTMATHQDGHPHPGRDCLAQAGPEGPIEVQHLGTVPHDLCRELLLEMGRRRHDPGATDRLLVAEHFPAFSVGTHHRIDPDLRPSLPAPLTRTEGTQSLSFHGPGQVSAYGCVLVREPVQPSEALQALGSAAQRAVTALGVAAAEAGPAGLLVDGRRVGWWHVRHRGDVILSEVTLEVSTAQKWREPRDRVCAVSSTTLAECLDRAVAVDAAADRLVEAFSGAFCLEPSGGLAGVIGPAGAREQ